jgi:hypothetical protein
MPRRRSPIAGLAAAALLLTASPAAAQVALLYPGRQVACGAAIRLGVRYDASTGASSRRVTVTVTGGGRTIFRRALAAAPTWTYWRIRPACGRTYTVAYASATALISYRVRVPARRPG